MLDAVGREWSHRAIVHQATGMIAMQSNADFTAALAWLRAQTYNHDVSLDVVAQAVLDGDMKFTP